MGNIRLLPASVVSQIAAGEVIERPAYAVKELIENALDAQPTFIKIEIVGSGLERIVVTDDGQGMTKEDILASFKLHTTSKIASTDDLIGVRSLGFRGEALASIAAVSDLTIQSRTATAASGSKVVLHGGELESVGSVGMSVGTIVTVENLFHTVPVRKKFLQALASESRLIFDVVTRLALANLEVRFFFTHNRKVIFTTSAHQSLSERLTKLLGTTLAAELIPLAYQDAHLSITGYIARPQHVAGKSKQYHFVNKRSISSPLITDTIRTAYGSLLEPKASATNVIFITIAPELVDVNIHPRKETVKFRHETSIVHAVQHAVAHTLTTHNLTFHDLRWQSADYHDAMRDQRLNLAHDAGTHSYAAGVVKQAVLPAQNLHDIAKDQMILQLHHLYLVISTPQGLVMLDQHAAHERILYEQFLCAFQQAKDQSAAFELLQVLMFDLPLPEAQALQTHLDLFARLGFDIDSFGSHTFKVNAVPRLFKDRNIVEIISEGVTDLISGKQPQDIDIRSQRMLTYLACRSAIKAGDRLTQPQMQDLIKDLARCENPYTCPHGRPTQYEITLKELHKMFRRR